jgi:hypothetical protein
VAGLLALVAWLVISNARTVADIVDDPKLKNLNMPIILKCPSENGGVWEYTKISPEKICYRYRIWFEQGTAKSISFDAYTYDGTQKRLISDYL